MEITPQLPVKNMKIDLEKFVGEVRRFGFLYDKRNKSYKDLHLKRKVWGAIGRQFGMNARETEKRWKVQRDRYNRERKKIKENIGAERYIPTWDLFNVIDEFLQRTGSVLDETTTNNVSSCWMQMDGQATTEEILQLCDESSQEEEDNVNCLPAVVNITDNNINHAGEDAADVITAVVNITENHREEADVSPMVSPTNSRCSSWSSGHYENKNAADFVTSVEGIGETSRFVFDYFKSKAETQQTDSLSAFCNFMKSRLSRLDARDQMELIHSFQLQLIEKEKQQKYWNT